MKKNNLFIGAMISIIIIMGIAQFYLKDNYVVTNNSNPVNNSTANNNENDRYEYGSYDNILITSRDLTTVVNNILKMPAYKTGYADYPDNTTYNNIINYKQDRIRDCKTDVYPMIPCDNITAYCIGFDDARIDAENKEAEMRKNNATLEVEKRIIEVTN